MKIIILQKNDMIIYQNVNISEIKEKWYRNWLKKDHEKKGG